jgi:hypothetical protein
VAATRDSAEEKKPAPLKTLNDPEICIACAILALSEDGKSEDEIRDADRLVAPIRYNHWVVLSNFLKSFSN